MMYYIYSVLFWIRTFSSILHVYVNMCIFQCNNIHICKPHNTEELKMVTTLNLHTRKHRSKRFCLLTDVTWLQVRSRAWTPVCGACALCEPQWSLTLMRLQIFGSRETSYKNSIKCPQVFLLLLEFRSEKDYTMKFKLTHLFRLAPHLLPFLSPSLETGYRDIGPFQRTHLSSMINSSHFSSCYLQLFLQKVILCSLVV